ncbi:MAG: TetR/AcrR family transcriptional regulator [Clostridiales bacterium]|nr:TetR/AcrR family transcriptional regulator [Clostridiales bacterium]
MSYEAVRCQRKAKILDSAKNWIARHGIVDTTVNDISKAANISRQTFYKYFSGIDDLVLEVQRGCIRHFMLYITDKCSGESSRETLKNILLKLLDFCTEFPDELNIISVLDSYALNNSSSEDYGKMYAECVLNNKKISEIIAWGQNDGEIRKDADFNVLRSITVNALIGTAQRFAAVKGMLGDAYKMTPADFINGAFDMIESYLAPKNS